MRRYYTDFFSLLSYQLYRHTLPVAVEAVSLEHPNKSMDGYVYA